ncbi:MAG: c-type cytochrome [Lysobacter sp.]
MIIGIFIWSGFYNIGADDTHTRPVHAVLQALRERSIEVRASELEPPLDLLAEARIRQGAGNYNAMCVGCHLAPGMAGTELSKGLYPAPPNLTTDAVDAAEAFWVIKHGIKASGMPAWGKSMDDEYIWNMAAFLQRLPELSAEQYEALVASSGGHDHGGGETQPHGHDEGMPTDELESHAGMAMDLSEKTDENKAHTHPPGTPADHHDTAAPAKPAPASASKTVEHRHADGTVESHPVSPQPATTPAAPIPDAVPDADDGHQHQH